MPLSIEFYHPVFEEWVEIHTVKPGTPRVIMPQLTPDNERKMYSIECDKTDSFASIYAHKVPDLLTSEELGLVNPEGMEVESEITVVKDKPEFISIKSNKEIERLVVRFTQK